MRDVFAEGLHMHASAHHAHSAERSGSSEPSDALSDSDGAPLPLLLRTLLDHCTSDTKPAERGILYSE